MSEDVSPIVEMILLADHVENIEGVMPAKLEPLLREQAEKTRAAYYKVVEEIGRLEGELEAARKAVTVGSALSSGVRYGLKNGFDPHVIKALTGLTQALDGLLAEGSSNG